MLSAGNSFLNGFIYLTSLYAVIMRVWAVIVIIHMESVLYFNVLVFQFNKDAMLIILVKGFIYS